MSYSFKRADWRLYNRPDLSAPRFWLAAACAASRLHATLTRHALHAFGDHGPVVSGCVRDHFPDAVKNELRALAKHVGECSTRARVVAPSRTHEKTIRRLGHLVATRDGSGFYGPQPLRGES